jgi:UDP-glucose 4-epimerase
MRILFTGASSFTGMWFVQRLIEQGHEVVAVLRSKESDYSEIRKERIEQLKNRCDLKFECSYGSEAFLDLIKSTPFSHFCHHAADVTNYKSPDFDPISALKNNAGPLKEILRLLSENGCKRVLLTGSVFEQGEGKGSEGLKAVSPYGLSKGLTSELFRYYCSLFPIHLGKFVIPNPFGPFEEFRFTSYLIKEWKAKKLAHVSMPEYVRDNVPVTLLANAYEKFAQSMIDTPGFTKTNPSFYVGSQGEFTTRFAKEMSSRLNLPCEYSLAKQTEFSEPKERYNIDHLDPTKLNWNEKQAWDQLAAYYER